MDRKIQKCPRCAFTFNTRPLSFSCNHLICPYCYLNDIFKIKITPKLDIPFQGPLTAKCTQCQEGEYQTSLEAFVSYLNRNNFIFPKCEKHNTQTTIYCKKCKIYLCADCENLFHSCYFKNHKDKMTTHPTFENGILSCKVHNKKIKYKCKECNNHLCSKCVNSLHLGHQVEKIENIVNKALNNIQLSTLEKYLKFIEKREIKIKDQIYNEYNKQIDSINWTIKQLETIKNNCTNLYDETFKYITNLFNFQRGIYYYYYNYFDSNNIAFNPILIYEKKAIETKKDIELTDKKIFMFLNVNIQPPITSCYFKEINDILIEYNKEKEYKFSLSQLFIYPKTFINIKETDNIKKGNKITALCFLPNKNYALGTKSGILYLYKSSPPFSLISAFRSHSLKISSISTVENIQPKLLVTASYDKTINFYDLSDGENSLFKTFKGHKSEITTMITINSDKILDEEELKTKKILLVSGGKDKNIKIWSIEDMKFLKTLTGHKGSIRSLLKLNEKEILSSGDDMMLMQWDIYTYECIKTFNPDTEVPIKFLVIFGMKQIGYAKTKGTFEFIKEGSFELINSPKGDHEDEITGIEYLKETGQLITCAKDKKLVLCDMEQFGEVFYRVLGHTGKIMKMIVNNDGAESQVITAGDDGQIIIWEVAY